MKLKKITTEGSSLITTEYAGNYVYENGILQFFNHAEGYFSVNSPPPSGELEGAYVYQYKDHLGNIRLSYSDTNNDGVITATTEILEENNYYPFGLKHKGYNNAQNGRDHKYGFGNKEEQNELGLGWIDITARNYDAALGRWMNLDPLAELMRRHSTYNNAFDNPVYFIDPDGNLPVETRDAAYHQQKFDEANARRESKGSGGNEEKEDAKENEKKDTNVDTKISSIIKEKGTTQIVDGIRYSYVGDAPDKINFKKDNDKKLITGIIEWAVYINSGNNAKLSEIVQSNPLEINDFKDGFIQNTISPLYKNGIRTIANENGDTVEVRYFDGFLNNSIDYVDINDRVGNYSQISFLASFENSNKQIPAILVRSPSNKTSFLNQIRKKITSGN